MATQTLPTPPGARGLPVLGESLQFLRDPETFTSERWAKYGPVFYSNMLGKPTVFMRGAEANYWIFSGEGKYLENEWSPAVRALLGEDCLSVISGEAHKRRRKLFAPHFRRVGMAACVPGIEQVVAKHIRRWRTDAELGPMAMVPLMRAAIFEIAATYVLGDVSDLGVPLAEASRALETFVAGLFVPLALEIPGTKFAAAAAARDQLNTWLEDLVMRRDADGRRGPDVLSTMLEVRDEHGEPLPRATIVDELLLLLFAGHDTTVTSSTNLLYHLALDPEAYAAVKDEQDQLDDRRFTLDTIRSMTYLEAAIKESMRLIPPIGGAFRVMLEDATFAGFRLPKGWRIAVGPRAVHFDPQLYPEPERFDPRRWQTGGPELPPFAYIPFGGGPRTCLGQHFAMLEMVVLAAMFVRSFDWRLVANQDLSFTQIPVPRPRSGLLLELEV